jgi:hypothetical protein
MSFYLPLRRRCMSTRIMKPPEHRAEMSIESLRLVYKQTRTAEHRTLRHEKINSGQLNLIPSRRLQRHADGCTTMLLSNGQRLGYSTIAV